jgi:hypothetical protein
MKQLLLLLFFVPLFTLGGVSGPRKGVQQERFAPVRGIVRDEAGQPLAAVTVTIKGTRTAHTSEYTGIRIGCNIPPKPFYSGFSKYNYNTTFNVSAPEVIMTAAEVWFLKA